MSDRPMESIMGLTTEGPTTSGHTYPYIASGPLKGMPKIGHLLPETDVEGGRISISHDLIDSEEYIIIRDQDLNEILKVHYKLWKEPTGLTGFTAEIRDSIIESIRTLYG